MKKVMVLILGAMMSLSAVCGLAGCSFVDAVAYANSDKYSVGEASVEGDIKNIEIDWPSGSVSIVTHTENAFTLTEKTLSGIPDDLRMHWWVDGDTLHVKYAASGAVFKLIDVRKKELTLAVPENVSFDDIVVRSASAEIAVGDISAQELNVSTASGEMNIGCAAKVIRLTSASGNVRLMQDVGADKVSIDTASGEIYGELSQVGKASFVTASGEIDVKAASTEAISAKSASGDIICELESAPAECSLNAVSGKVALIVPEETGFTAEISTVSGDFESDLALRKDGKTYISGSGDAQIDIETTSGDISIRRR